jgi:BlaI family transcriptional regulator, penicillinase repressor
MARTPQDVTDAELAVLEILWRDGPATIRRLTDLLYPQGGSAHYATVQKLLERLESKAYVEHRREVTPHTFLAAVGREELIGRRLQATAEKLCGGSLTPLLMHLVRANSLSVRERQELRSLIDDLDQAKRPPKGRRGSSHA